MPRLDKMTDADSMVDRWFEILGYDEDSSTIVLHFDDRRNAASEANRLLSKMRKKYKSDMLLFCVLRHTVELHKDVHISVREALGPQFRTFASFLEEVENSPLNSNVTQFRKALEKFVTRPNLIGEISDDDICARISEVASLRHISDECLKSSGLPVKLETGISKDVIVAPTLGELLLKTAGMPDGMVLGYVTPRKANEGFFSLMYKSNGNIVSVNDRPVEEYFGQFGVLSGRNDRYTEDKAFSVFPYESVLNMTFKESGIHTLVDNAEVKKENLSFNDFTVDEALRFFVGCLLISSVLAGATYKAEQIRYTTALTKDNLPLLESKALINPGNRDIAETYNILKLEISDTLITSPPKEYRDLCGKNTAATLFREFYTPDMADLHSDYSEVLPEIRREYPNEMIRKKEDLEAAVLHDIRRKLRDKIQMRIDAYYHEHGDGAEGIEAYRKIVAERKDVLLKNLTEKYNLKDAGRWEKESLVIYMYSRSGKYHVNREYLPLNDLENVVEKDSSASTRYSRYGKAYLKDEGGMCNMVFEWKPYHVEEICAMLEISEKDLPKEMRGYNRNHNSTARNSLLDITDACESLQNGYISASNRIYSPFNVTIAMSKKKWKSVFWKKTNPSKVNLVSGQM